MNLCPHIWHLLSNYFKFHCRYNQISTQQEMVKKLIQSNPIAILAVIFHFKKAVRIWNDLSCLVKTVDIENLQIQLDSKILPSQRKVLDKKN